MTNSEARDEFLASLRALEAKAERLPAFRGKTVALRALRRISTLSALR
jgi:hypothetical protein